MVSPSRRTSGQAGGVTNAKSLLTWTLLLLSAAAGQVNVDHYVPTHRVHSSATVDVIPVESPRPEAGSSPAEIPLLKKDAHTARFRSTEQEHNGLNSYQYADAPAPKLSVVRAPPEQSAESSALTAISGARLLQDWEADDIVLLSTVDGSLHARDRKTGQHRWTIDMLEDPMIYTVRHPQNRSQLDDGLAESDYMFIVEPSSDGQLYAQFMNPAVGLKKLDVTVKKMTMETPYTMPFQGRFLTTCAERLTKSYIIDVSNGEILSELPKHRSSVRSSTPPRCRRRNELEIEDPACRPGRTIRIGKTIHTFIISDERNEEELWTIRFSEWSINKRDSDLQQQYLHSLDGLEIQNHYNGKVFGLDSYAADAERLHRYYHPFESPIARIFDVVRPRDDLDESTDLVVLSRPKDLPFASTEVQTWRNGMKNSQHVFVSKTEQGQWFAMSEESYPGFTQKAPYAHAHLNRDGALLDIDGELEEIVGVHILSGEQPAEGPIMLTIGASPENENNNAIDTGKQAEVPEPPQVPAVITNNVDTKSWGSGLLGLILGGVIVLLLNSKLHFTGHKPFQIILKDQETESFSSENDRPVVILTDDIEPLEQVKEVLQSETVPSALVEEQETDGVVVTPGHSRVQSATSVNSPKKKFVKIGDADDNNSTDAESEDEEGINDPAHEENGDQAVTDNSTGAQPRKPKTKRGKRGGKRNKKKKSVDPAAFDEKRNISVEQHLDNGMVQIGRLKVDLCEEKCLGRGSNGTAVYPGILDGREVAVKRLIKSANNLAEKEIKHLVSSDENQHVIRYFGKEESRDFFYIALDQFTTSLDQFIEHPEKFPTLVDKTKGFDVKDCLRQITDGVQHLHSLKLVHRDIKPQNVLVRAVKSNRLSIGMPRLQFVISDFGLCKPLEDGAMSTFAPTANHTAAGTTGWRAPELLVSPRDAIAAPNAESSTSRTVSTTHSMDGTAIDLPTGRRATKAIDIFSLGCVFYYVMTRGGHPFDVGGSSLGRDLNIKENNFTTELMRFHKYEYDAEDLIMQMVNHEPKNRPDTSGVLKHPYFWNTEQKLEFVCLVSDCYEREKNSIENFHAKSPVTRTPDEEESLAELAALESLAPNVIGVNSKMEIRDFLQALPRTFLNGMGKQRSYTGTRMIDLLRLIRNKKNHFRDLPEDVQTLILARGGSQEEGYYSFWADRFPALLINCHANIVERQLVERFRLERWYE